MLVVVAEASRWPFIYSFLGLLMENLEFEKNLTMTIILSSKQ